MKTVKKKFNLVQLKIRHTVWSVIIGLGIFFTVVIGFYWLAVRKTDQVLIERLEGYELSMARSSALSITEFLKTRKKELVLLSELEVIQAEKETEGMEILNALAKELKKENVPVGNIVRVDKGGFAVWGVNVRLGKQDEAAKGVYLGDRACFLWAKEEGEKGRVFIAEPILAEGGFLKGKRVVSMNTPVFYKGEFNGLIVTTFLVDELSNKFIEPLFLTPNTYYSIFNEQGTLIISTFAELVGRNILQVQEEGNWPEDSRLLVKRAIRGEEGVAYHGYTNLLTKKPEKAVSAYSPIKINGDTWSLWVSIPYARVEEVVLPLRQQQVFTLVVVLSGLLILVLIFIFGIRVAQREGFVNGFRDGRDGVKKLKKKG